MKRVLLTGGAGFIGHHVIDYLLRKTDWNIVTIDRLDLSGNLHRIHDVLSFYPPETKKRLEYVYHDLKAPITGYISHAIGEVDIILHLAAASHVDRSIDCPMEFAQDNVIGTVNILDFARTQKNLEKFVYFSTDEVFGPAPGKIMYSEYDRYSSTNPYSASKAAGEEFCVAYQNTYGLPIIVTHTMNVFGIRQHEEKYIPKAIRSVLKGETLTIHSDPTKTFAGSRFYINTEDVADGLFFLLNLKEYPVVDAFNTAKCPKFNLVGKEEIDNLQLAQMISAAQNKELKYEMVDFHTSRPGHDLRYGLSGDLMRSLGWEPQVSLSQRIQQVTDWYLNNLRWLGI